jgi:hypothetical protein
LVSYRFQSTKGTKTKTRRFYLNLTRGLRAERGEGICPRGGGVGGSVDLALSKPAEEEEEEEEEEMQRQSDADTQRQTH